MLAGHSTKMFVSVYFTSELLHTDRYIYQIRTGAECVTLSVVSATEPLYAASCLRLCLDNLQEPTSASEARNEEHETYGWTFAMGLKALGALFSLLPSEVLEEEIVRSRELIKKVSTLIVLVSDPLSQYLDYPRELELILIGPQAINSPQAGLRQTAATMLVKAHQVIQNDNKLFELVDGLTKSQINLCTYLFARTLSNTS